MNADPGGVLTTTDCPPLADRITKSLLGYGVIAGPLYVLSVAVQAVTRDGFDPTRHAASQLANGDLGWIQIATFAVCGAMTIAAGVGVGRALGRGRRAMWTAGLLCGYGLALMLAGLFRADPSDGFPPGTPAGPGVMTWHGITHFAVAGVGFACLVAACFVFGGWPSRIVGLVFAASFVWLSSGQGGTAALLAFTVAVVLSWAWLCAVSIRLYRSV
ncbi:DUF998 domain-containing protein [Mycobacterium sp. C3-094]